MYCKQCGKELPEGTVFCDRCGTKQAESNPFAKTEMYRFPKAAVIAVSSFVFVLVAVIVIVAVTSGKPVSAAPNAFFQQGAVPAMQNGAQGMDDFSAPALVPGYEAPDAPVRQGSDCWKCGGTGKVQCTLCHGTGYLVTTEPNPYVMDDYHEVEKPCPECEDGYILCIICHGTGKTPY